VSIRRERNGLGYGGELPIILFLKCNVPIDASNISREEELHLDSHIFFFVDT